MSGHVLELENVTKRFGDFTAVHDVSLSIPRGSIYGFLGPNGAGKTTTIRMIFDIIKPYPANKLEALHGGLGIMADDAMAAVYSNLALRLVIVVARSFHWAL